MSKFKGGKPQKETYKGKAPKDEKKEVIFPEGITVFSPHEKAPDFVKAEVFISIDQLMEYVDNNEVTTEHQKYGRQLKLSLKESKEGKLYFDVNTYGIEKQ